MKINVFSIIIAFAALSLGLTSCSGDDPIIEGSSVQVNNTFTSDAFTGGAELAIEDLFAQPAGSLFANSTVTDAVEFPAYLLGLYDINISADAISFDCVAASDDPTYGDLFRVLEANTFDRYYFNFDMPHNITGFEVNNDFVNLRIDSDTEIVVEILAGYDFNPDIQFTIELKN